MKFTSKLLAVALTCSTFSAFAKSPIMDQFEEMKASGLSVDISAYEREENYEKENLSFDERANLETQKLIEDMSAMIGQSYDAAMKMHQDEELAKEEILMAVSKDTELAAGELKLELRKLARTILEAHMRGESGTVTTDNASKIKSINLEQSIIRSKMLQDSNLDSMKLTDRDDELGIKKEFKSKQELLTSLISNKDSAPNPSSSTLTMKSGRQFTSAQSVSAQVSLEFLGSKISAGPVIEFKKVYSTEAIILAVGMNPILLPDGNFDMFKRDSKYQVLKKNGSNVRREISFNCSAQVNFSSEYKGAGGFKVMGVGATASISQTYTNSVSLDTRRIAIPDYVGGKSVTLSFLSDLCHNDFLKTKIAGVAVTRQLDAMMKIVVASLVFSHPKTKCATDNDCINWFNNEVISWHKTRTYPRCAPEATGREKFFACSLRGLKNANCPIVKNGKLTSDGGFEYQCDKGLKCVQTKQGGWFTQGQIKAYDEGKCMPINANTYVSPLESRGIQIRFVK